MVKPSTQHSRIISISAALPLSLSPMHSAPFLPQVLTAQSQQLLSPQLLKYMAEKARVKESPGETGQCGSEAAEMSP